MAIDKKKVIVIGSGFSSLSAACFLQKAGFAVQVIEHHTTPGGRARQLIKDGFTFDMGPSWYWMPDVFDYFFKQFDKQTSDFYTLQRLDPSYRIFWEDGSLWDIPAEYEHLRSLLEQEEKGAARHLDRVLKEAKSKYEIAMNQGVVQMTGTNLLELVQPSILANLLKFDIFSSVHRHIAGHFKSLKIHKLLEFPVLFLGATADKIPSLYTLMNYADIILGTWHPQGGMYKVVEAMYQVAVDLGVQFSFEEKVEVIKTKDKKVIGVQTDKSYTEAAVVVSGADYHHTEKLLLNEKERNYSEQYWSKKTFAPSATLFYIGLDKKLDKVCHHNLFFDADFEQFADELYKQPTWSKDPLFYLNVPSVTDASMAPPNKDGLFLLVPVPPGLAEDTAAQRDIYLQKLLIRMEMRTGTSIRNHICFTQSFGLVDFEKTYHAYKGNAYGLANTLLQTAHLKPKCINKQLDNLFYTGQLTVPGPGVPPALISGEIVANLIIKKFH